MKDNSYLEISQGHPYKSWIWRKAIDQVTEIKRASNWRDRFKFCVNFKN